MDMAHQQGSLISSKDADWKSDNFRQKVMSQIKDAFENAGLQTNRQTCEDMENQVFSKATKRDEYMAFVARLILHVKTIKRNQAQGMPAQDPNAVSAGLGYINTARMMGKQSPPPGTIMNRQNQQFNIPLHTQPGMASSQHVSQMFANQQQPQPNWMSAPSPQMGQSHSTNMQNFPQQQMTGMQQPPPPSHAPPSAAAQMSTAQGNPPSVGATSGMRAHTPSPAGQMTVARSPAPSLHAAAPSPAQLVAASPSSQMIPPSPAPPHPSGATGVPSPSLVNPGSVGPVHSPAPPITAAEEQIYWEKHRQLSKYIEPLKRMMNRMTQDESKEVNLPIGLKMSKLKSLMDMLTSTTPKVTLKILEKCEIALQKLDEKPTPQPSSVPSTSTSQTARTATATTTIQTVHYQENALCQPLLDAVKRHAQNPMLAHSLHRSFTPALMAFDAPAIQPPNPPAKRFCPDSGKKRSPLPHALQGELSRLGGKFKVIPALMQEREVSTTVLTCTYVDDDSPSVPPITIKVPGNYPFASPEYKASDYDSTPFLQNIEMKLSNRLLHTSNLFSVTALLDAWESSIRHAVKLDCNEI